MNNCYNTPGIYNPPETEFTVFMEIPSNAPKKLGNLIGPNGRILKAITHQSETMYIWCNGKNIEICGNDMSCIQDAIRRIHARCDYLENKEPVVLRVDSDEEGSHCQHGCVGNQNCPACG